MRVWTGRVDEADGPSALRWHQMVRPLSRGAEPGVVLVGFACDEGVRRNGGRVGARDGPLAVRAALANLAWYQQWPVYDWGDVRCDGTDMEGAQARLAALVDQLVTDGHRPLVIGGGHETAWGTHQGVAAARPRHTVGVVNVDAHLDLRADAEPNSGTPFAQIERFCRERNRPFKYFALGLAKQSNTAALFERAAALGATALNDFDLVPWALEPVHKLVADFMQPCGSVHLSVDLDVLPGAVMPAVSAPAARGVPLEVVEPLIVRCMSTGKVAAVDLVEFAPNLDRDGNAARVAARLAWFIATSWRAGKRS
ncbi:MAG: formimidoylglutamase [Planctomycetes bacterium]|nr:formimidoylglutamase [Planctomycetota bacterium]